MIDWPQERHDAAKAACKAFTKRTGQIVYPDYLRDHHFAVAAIQYLPAALARIEEFAPFEAAMDEQDGIISDLKARIEEQAAEIIKLVQSLEQELEIRTGVDLENAALKARISELSLELADQNAQAEQLGETEKVPLSCPDSIPGCAALHYKWVNWKKRAKKAEARILELETRGVPLEKFDKVAEVNVTYEAELSNLLAAFGETKSRLDASLNRNTALEARVAELEADNKNVSFNSAGLMEICEKHMARITELEAMTTVGSPTERYPTVWAYEMSCETIRKREARIAELEADSREVDAWKKLEAELRSCRDEVGFVLVDVIEEQKIMDALTELDEIRRQK